MRETGPEGITLSIIKTQAKKVRFESVFKSVDCPRDERAGKLFHTTGLATEKALSPNFVIVRGTE